MAQKPRLDDKYFDGVYYDYEACGYCSLVRLEDGVGFVRPLAFDAEPFHEMTTDEYHIEDIQDTLEMDIRKVSDEAVENPAGVVTKILDAVNGDQYGMGGPTQQEMIDLGYARQHVEIINDE